MTLCPFPSLFFSIFSFLLFHLFLSFQAQQMTVVYPPNPAVQAGSMSQEMSKQWLVSMLSSTVRTDYRTTEPFGYWREERTYFPLNTPQE